MKKRAHKVNPRRKTSQKENVPQKSFLSRLSPFQKVVAAEVIFGAIVLGIVILVSRAATTVTTSPSPSVANNCGKRVSTYSFESHGDASLPWNVPVCAPGMTRFSQSDDYRDRLWNYAIAPDTSTRYMKDTLPNRLGKFETSFGLNPGNDYSTPIYRVSDKQNGATTTIQVQVCGQSFCIPSNLDTTNWSEQTAGGKGYLPSTAIPWNPNWKPAAGKDKEMIILDDTKSPKRAYELWGVNFDLEAVSNCGLLFRDRLCTYSAEVFRDADGNIADYTTSSAIKGRRGLGLTEYPMTITPEEVAQGEIRQALYMEAFNTMIGPTCTADQLKSGNYSVLGKTCGYAVAPATQHEWKDATDITRKPANGAANCPELASPQYKDVDTGLTIAQRVGLEQMIPSGMRFALDMTDSEIDAWLATKTDYSARKKQTARIFAVALRDYGWIVGDTTCWGAHFPLAGSANPVAKQRWADLGIVDASSQNLLDGLFRREKIYVVSPSTNLCMDGTTSQFACSARTSNYPSVSNAVATMTPKPSVTNTPTPTPKPVVTQTPIPTPTPTPVPTTVTALPAPAQLGIYQDSWVCVFCRTTISWSAVTGAAGYEVTIDGYKYRTAANSYDMWGFFYIQSPYSATVAAVDNKGNLSSKSITRKFR